MTFFSPRIFVKHQRPSWGAWDDPGTKDRRVPPRARVTRAVSRFTGEERQGCGLCPPVWREGLVIPAGLAGGLPGLRPAYQPCLWGAILSLEVKGVVELVGLRSLAGAGLDAST